MTFQGTSFEGETGVPTLKTPPYCGLSVAGISDVMPIVEVGEAVEVVATGEVGTAVDAGVVVDVVEGEEHALNVTPTSNVTTNKK